MFNFEKLVAWQKGLSFADRVYAITKRFPSDERFGLTLQMRRAAVSLVSNLAEGSSRFSAADFARFIEIATGSLYEVVSQAHIANRQTWMNDSDLKGLLQTAEELSRMLSGLRGAIRGKEGGIAES
jgi:four helix bundle protein